MASEQELIRQLALRYGVDPRAVLAIASVEGGFHGSVGDNGTSFGPFQEHIGGALPRGLSGARAQRWANSPAGIQYAIRHIAEVAHGLHGRQAVAAISSRFERPANVPAEIAKAMSRYGGVSSGGGYAVGGFAPQGRASFGGSSPEISSLIQQILQRNAQGIMPLAPQLDPQAVRYGLNS